MNGHGFLREQLREQNPTLHHALERSWEICQKEWVSGLEASDGSSNSLSHFFGVEHQLDHIVQAFSRVPASAPIVKFAAAELYLLLASALFHDIGRLRTGPKGENHGTKSREIIAGRYGELGIPSSELARSLGRICEYHNPAKENPTTLHLTAIDPYGEIREDFLAALLTLADTMDDAFTRVVPRYIGDAKLGPKGIFRRCIRSVLVDPEAQMIRTVVTPADAIERLDKTEAEGRKWFVMPVGDRPQRPQVPNPDEAYFSGYRHSADTGVWDMILGLAQERFSLRSVGPAENLPEGATLLAQTSEETPALMSDADRILGAASLAVVLQDTADNSRALNKLATPLATAGLCLTAWVVDRDEMLFNTYGQKTYEPVLSVRFLEDVAKAMWELSTQVLGVSRFSYEELASQVGNPSTARVRMAARRLAVAMRDQDALWAGTTHWSWRKNHLNVLLQMIRTGLKPPFYA
jgi:hypothetical protein